MTDRIMAVLAFVVLAIFVGILAFNLMRIDLFIVCGVTMALVAYDFFIDKKKG